MGRFKKLRDKNKIRSGFVALTWDLLNSESYINLPHAAKGALPYFWGRIRKSPNDPERYHETFVFSYSEGKRLGYASGTFSKIIQDLVRFGFLDPVDKGGLRGTSKSYNVFLLSTRWEAFSTPEFKKSEWRCFVPKPRHEATVKSETYSFKT